MELRVMSEKGEEKFREYLLKLKNGEKINPSKDVLANDTYSTIYYPQIKFEFSNFGTRLEFAKYLFQKLGGVDGRDLTKKAGIWSWLALFYFDSICPAQADGSRKVKEVAKYICSSDYSDYYRHLVAAAFMIIKTHGEDNSMLFLSCPMHVHNDMMEQLASRQYIISNRNLVSASHLLYWDYKRKKIKTNASNRMIPGNLRRLISLVDQLEINYDLNNLAPHKIMNLLPAEFDQWKR